MNKNDILLNPKCMCNKFLIYTDLKLVIAYPCNHIYHEDCSKNIKNCFFCKKKIIFFFNQEILDKYKYKNKNIFQMWVDINSCRYKKYNISSIDNLRLSLRLPYLLYLFYSCYSNPTRDNIFENIDCFLKNCNININVKNKYLDRNIKKIYVLNHSNNLDSIISFKVLKCGFLASTKFKENGFMDIINKITPCLIINRGLKNNSVKQIKDFVDKNNKIFIFPEGMLTNNNFLGEFRSGAFVTGYPVQPVIIKYKTELENSNNPTNFIINIVSKEKIDVDVTFLPIIKTKYFDKDFITNYVRVLMANKGNFYLSRITNRSIKE